MPENKKKMYRLVFDCRSSF